MASRGSLNKVLLIGNLTRDPELRYTPSGAAVCTFGLATNRVYTASDGTKKEDAEFHRIVVWNKLAELCSQLLTKGRKVYVEGRLQTRSWTTPAGDNRQTTEIVIEDMKILDRKPTEELGELTEGFAAQEPPAGQFEEVPLVEGGEEKREAAKSEKAKKATKSEKQQESLSKKPEPESRGKQKQSSKEEASEKDVEESTEELIKDLPF